MNEKIVRLEEGLYASKGGGGVLLSDTIGNNIVLNANALQKLIQFACDDFKQEGKDGN